MRNITVCTALLRKPLTLIGMSLLMATGISVRADYVFSTIDHPATGLNGVGRETLTSNFSGTSLVGGYGSWFGDASIHGFILTGTNWLTLDSPSAGSGASQGTYVTAKSGADVVGWFVDSNNITHGFLNRGSNWVTLDALDAGLSSSGGTYAQGIDGTQIAGFFIDTAAVNHGFLYDSAQKTWSQIDCPLAGSASGQGTVCERISGSSIVGQYIDVNGLGHGFLLKGTNWTTLDAPGSAPGSTIAFNLSGSDIVGSYSDTNGLSHGFLLRGTNWITLDSPLAGSGPNQGSIILGVDNEAVVGTYVDKNGFNHGFLGTPKPQLAITKTGDSFDVSWPYWNNSISGWSLQKNTGLNSSAWTSISASSTGTNNQVTIDTLGINWFFRLIKK